MNDARKFYVGDVLHFPRDVVINEQHQGRTGKLVFIDHSSTSLRKYGVDFGAGYNGCTLRANSDRFSLAKQTGAWLTAEELSQAVLEGTAPTAPTAPKAGLKYDSDKPIAAVLYQDFPQALSAVVDVATFGAKKYARSSWRTVPDAAQRYADAMHRHMLAQARGERLDPDSGLPHCAHIAWNALALAELELCTGMGADKLSATGPAAGSADGASSTHCAPKPEFVFGRVVDGNCLSTKSVTVTIGGGASGAGGAGCAGGAGGAGGGAGTGSTAVFSGATYCESCVHEGRNWRKNHFLDAAADRLLEGGE